MANPGTVVAHVVKAIVTVACMRFFKDSFAFQTNDRIWAVRACQLMLVHSILGILRYGSSNTTKRFRNCYEWFSSLVEILPFACFTAETMTVFKAKQEVKVLLLLIGCLPLLVESLFHVRDRQKLSLLTDAVVSVQAAAMASLCFTHEAYGIISLAMSYAVTRIVSEDFCDRYDVPYVDLSQYSLCFVEIFATAILKDT